MNNKEFTSELAQRLSYTQKDVSEWITILVSSMVQEWEKGESITIHGFGSFEIRKRMERISVVPSSSQRMLVPPKLSLIFRPSRVLKDRFNSVEEQGELSEKGE